MNRFIMTLLIAAGLLAGGDALAGRHPDRDPAFAKVRKDRGGLDAAVAEVRERTRGRVLSAETREREGRRFHYIRVLMPNGEVRRIRVQADPGKR